MRVATGSSAVIVLVVYRPGSQTITAQFFAELADVLDRVVVFTDPVLVTEDFNVRLDRADLLLVCVSFTIIGQPRNSVLIRRV